MPEGKSEAPNRLLSPSRSRCTREGADSLQSKVQRVKVAGLRDTAEESLTCLQFLVSLLPCSFPITKPFCRIGLISDLWTPENDMLTAAMKLKRPLIAEKHKRGMFKICCVGIFVLALAEHSAG